MSTDTSFPSCIYGHGLYVPTHPFLRAGPYVWLTPVLWAGSHGRYVPTHPFFRAYGHVLSHVRTYVQSFSCLRTPLFPSCIYGHVLYVPTHPFYVPARTYGRSLTYGQDLMEGTYLRTRFFVPSGTFHHKYVPTYRPFRVHRHLFSIIHAYPKRFSCHLVLVFYPISPLDSISD